MQVGKEKKMKTKYYEGCKELAREIRKKYNLNNHRILPSQMIKICKSEGVDYIDLNPHFKKVRGAYYYNSEEGASIVIKKGLPRDPYSFTIGHELKHHLTDRHKLISCCLDNSIEEVEIGAEIFSAELIFPENDFVKILKEMNVSYGSCTATHIVELKNKTQTTLSYAGLAKRAEFFGFANSKAFTQIKWKKLEEELYGIPFYKVKR